VYQAYGAPFGAVLVTLALLPLATVFGLSVALVGLAGIVCGSSAVLLWPRPESLSAWRELPQRMFQSANRSSLSFFARKALSRIAWLPALVILAILVRWAFLFGSALIYDDRGLWAGHIWVWGDWALHMGDVSSFAYGDNFPPMEPRLTEYPFSYHYLVSLSTALLVKLGMDTAIALNFHSFVFSSFVVLALYAFGRRLTGDQTIASFAVILFLLGGGFAWVLLVGDIERSHDLIGTLRTLWAGDRETGANITWHNTVFAFILAQRPYLFGIPLGLLTLTLLHKGIEERNSRLFDLAGMVAGILPFAHLGTMLALALITPFLLLLFPRRDWIRFFLIWGILALPQFLVQQAGGSGAAGSLRLLVGWETGPDPWLWFWLKNLGLFVPLLLLALSSRRLLPKTSQRFLWAFMPIFAVANLVAFQPWPWDNTKVLFYWFLGVSILVAALIVRTWRKYRAPLVYFLLSLTVATMVMSGVIANLQQAMGKDRLQLLTSDEIELAKQIGNKTSPKSIFVVGLQHNHPVSMLTGRPVVMGFPGWIWTHGMNYGPRESDVRAIYAFAPNTPQLLERYGVDYVAIGPIERDQLHANVGAFHAHYPIIIKTAHYEVFDVRGPGQP
jgi:hypothetical protein